MAREKKVMLRDMQAHDALCKDCTVRQLEMTVDAALADSRYSVQFWKDVGLYGVDGAISYLENNPKLLRWNSGLEKVKKVAEEVKARIRRGVG